MLKIEGIILKLSILVIFVFSIFGCAISDANVKSFEGYEKLEEGYGYVFFTTSFKSYSWLGIGPSVLLNFSKDGLYSHSVSDQMKLEIMTHLDKEMHFLKLPEGRYAFRGYHLENATFNSSWDLWCDNCFEFPFVVKNGGISYAGHVELSLSKTWAKTKLKHIDKFDSDMRLFNKSARDFDDSLMKTIEKPFIWEQMKLIKTKRKF